MGLNYKEKNKMRVQLLGLVVLICCMGHGNPTPALLSTGSQSDCPTVAIEYPGDIDQSVFKFKVKISGGKMTYQALTYKWTVVGGELEEGQGTPSVSIINFDLRKKSLTVSVIVSGLPEGCDGSAACSISV